jgi:general stress protein 26
MILALFVLLVTAPARSQVTTQIEAPEPADVARAIASSAETCFLITVDKQNQPQARMMQNIPPDPDWTIWMGTHPKTRKVEQIRANPKVAVTYADETAPGYVTVLGNARVVSDKAVLAQHWRKEWESFFPGGPDGPNFVLIEITPTRIELVSEANGVSTAPGAPPVILEKQDGAWKPGRR